MGRGWHGSYLRDNGMTLSSDRWWSIFGYEETVGSAQFSLAVRRNRPDDLNKAGCWSSFV